MFIRFRRRVAWWLCDVARWIDPDWSLDWPPISHAQARRILDGVMAKIEALEDETDD